MGDVDTCRIRSRGHGRGGLMHLARELMTVGERVRLSQGRCLRRCQLSRVLRDRGERSGWGGRSEAAEGCWTALDWKSREKRRHGRDGRVGR